MPHHKQTKLSQLGSAVIAGIHLYVPSFQETAFVQMSFEGRGRLASVFAPLFGQKQGERACASPVDNINMVTYNAALNDSLRVLTSALNMLSTYCLL
jgi:hypothetical protein